MVFKLTVQAKNAIGERIASMLYPQPLHILKSIDDGELDPEQPTGWRLTGQLAGTDVSIDVRDKGCISETPVMTALVYGDHISEARAKLRSQSQFQQGGTYDTRFLSIPGLGVEALWFHTDDGPDFVCPYLTPAGLRSRPTPMKLDDFIKALKVEKTNNGKKQQKQKQLASLKAEAHGAVQKALAAAKASVNTP